MREKIVEAEVDTATDGNLWFAPLRRTIRGRLDFLRLAQRMPDAIRLSMDYPKGIPGQRIRIDLATGACAIIEPLREPYCTLARGKIEKQGIDIPKDEEFTTGQHVPDWLWAIHRAVRDGLARVVRGELPADLGTETPRPEPQDAADRKIDRLCELVERLLDRLAAPAR